MSNYCEKKKDYVKICKNVNNKPYVTNTYDSQSGGKTNVNLFYPSNYRNQTSHSKINGTSTNSIAPPSHISTASFFNGAYSGKIMVTK